MFGRKATHYPSLYLLADHLDAALANGEDLLMVHGSAEPLLATLGANGIGQQSAVQRQFVERVRTLELAMAMRVLQARQRAEDLWRADSRVAAVARLFIGGTAALADAVADLGDSTLVDFQTGDDAVAYLRSRGVIAADAAGIKSLDQLIVTPGFLLAERIALGTLMDLAATFLDTLELFYELYAEESPCAARTGIDETTSYTAGTSTAG
jgi:hypothetical protein